MSVPLSECPLLLRTAVRCVRLYFNGVVDSDFEVLKRARYGGDCDFDVVFSLNLSSSYGPCSILKLSSSTQPPETVWFYLYSADETKIYGYGFAVSEFLSIFGAQLSECFPSCGGSPVDPVNAVISELTVAVEAELREIASGDDLYSAVTRAIEIAFVRKHRPSIGALLLARCDRVLQQ